MRYRKPSWEVKSFSATTNTQAKTAALKAGWEPFAVAGGKLYVRRQVSRKG